MNTDLMEFEANFSVLDRYGTYVTKEDYITDPAIGRDKEIERAKKLSATPIGSGHDQFLTSIVVQFDLTFPLKTWVDLHL